MSVFLYFGSTILVPKPILWQTILKMFYIEDNTQPYWLRSSRTGFFQAMRQFSQKVRRPFPFSCSRQKSELQWARFLSKSQKSHFGGIFRPFRPVKPFSENPLSVCLLLYDSPTLCKKSGKTEESFLRSCLVNRRTDRAKLMEQCR